MTLLEHHANPNGRFFFFVTKESTRKQQERGKFEPGSCELNNQVGKKKKISITQTVSWTVTNLGLDKRKEPSRT